MIQFLSKLNLQLGGGETLPPFFIMTFLLRPYQKHAVDSAFNHIRFSDEHGYITAPGGSGKSVMIAKLAERINQELDRPVMILARSERLLSQNGSKIDGDVGYYCAGLNQKDLTKDITVASVQSLAAADLTGYDKNPIVLIDEAHELPPESNEESQYRALLKQLGEPQIIGFTATPFRTGQGNIAWGKEIINIPIQPLFDEGFIVPPKNKIPFELDTKEISILGGEFNQAELEDAFLEGEMVSAAMRYLSGMRDDFKHILVFCQSLRHCEVLTQPLKSWGLTYKVVSGDTPKKELNGEIIPAFERGEIQYLLNCNLMTTGYDIPCIDAVVVARSTVSKGLFEQVVYRGTRTYENKKDFLLVDMGGNLMRHGGLGSPTRETQKKKGEVITPKGKVCPECESFIEPINLSECTECGYVFIKDEPRKINHETEADTQSQAVHNPIVRYEVTDQFANIHTKRSTGSKSIAVTYMCPAAPYRSVKEFFAVHHESDFPRVKANQYLNKLNHPYNGNMKEDSLETVMLHFDNIPKLKAITVDTSEKYVRVIGYELAEKKELELHDEILF